MQLGCPKCHKIWKPWEDWKETMIICSSCGYKPEMSKCGLPVKEVKMEKLYELSKELKEAFIHYQYRLEHPFPSSDESPDKIRLEYLNNPLFHNKVDLLTSGVMSIVSKYL